MSNDVYFYEAFTEEIPALQRHLAPTLVAGFTPKTIQEESAHTPPTSLISIRTQSVIPTEWAPHLRGILSRSTGYDHLQAFLAKTKNAPACGYLPEYCGQSVAEHAALLWLSLMRRLPAQITQFSRFARDGITGTECENKSLLVVGVGEIGYRVAHIGFGLGMRIQGVDLVQRHPDIHYVTLTEGLSRADVIVCAMNLTPENRHYFRYEVLKQARPGALFINVARGEFASAVDLLRLLEEGILGGIGLDVFNEEQDIALALRRGQPPTGPELRALLELGKRPDVILTPHNAFNTREALDRKARLSAQQIQTFLTRGSFLWSLPA